jgi:hypothetical protein
MVSLSPLTLLCTCRPHGRCQGLYLWLLALEAGIPRASRQCLLGFWWGLSCCVIMSCHMARQSKNGSSGLSSFPYTDTYPTIRAQNVLGTVAAAWGPPRVTTPYIWAQHSMAAPTTVQAGLVVAKVTASEDTNYMAWWWLPGVSSADTQNARAMEC